MVISFFPAAADPHSYLLAQALPHTLRRFPVLLRFLVVSPRRARATRASQGASTHETWTLADGHSALPAVQDEWAVRDAALSAKVHGLVAFTSSVPSAQNAELEALADAALVSTVMEMGRGTTPALNTDEAVTVLGRVCEIFDALSRGDRRTLLHMSQAVSEREVDQVIRDNNSALAQDHNHYLPGVLSMDPDIYWSVDRLSHLDERLACMGLERGGCTEDKKWTSAYSLSSQSLVTYPAKFSHCGLDAMAGSRLLSPGDSAARGRKTLTFFYSFRSPYSQLAVARIFAIARFYGVPLVVRPVLPMVMRPGRDKLAVPKTKQWYIMEDTIREAEKVGFPRIVMNDPLDAAALRCFAVWFGVLEVSGLGVQEAFLRSFSHGQYCEGIDFATDRGLRVICERAGLDVGLCLNKTCPNGGLGDRGVWEAQESRNREMLDNLGLWGVPSFQYGDDFSCWGQDRMRALELAIIGDLDAESS